MKKKMLIPVVMSVFLLIIGVVLVSEIEKNGKTAGEIHEEEVREELMPSVAPGEEVVLTAPDSGIVKDGTAEIMMQGAKCTVLGYDYFYADDISSQTKYPFENFQLKEDYLVTTNYSYEIGCYDWMEENYPEKYQEWRDLAYKDVLSEEYINTEKEYYDIIDKEFDGGLYEATFVFLKCRIENTTKRELLIENIGFDTMVTDKDYTYYESRISASVYFDKSQNTEGDDRYHIYYWYTMEPGEVLECVLGYKVFNTYEIEDTSPPDIENIYMGFEDETMRKMFDSGESPYSPIYGKQVFKVTDLNKIE